MQPMIGGVAFVLALLCAAAMGLALQRGATCTVAAVHELLTVRRPTRLLAIAEASLWVAGGLLLAKAAGRLDALPAGYALTRWTFVGAALLGLGAVVNRGCVFGTVARLGTGEWAYLATPVGFYLGCLSVDGVFAPMAPRSLAGGSPVLGAPGWVVWIFVAFALMRVAQALRSARPTITQAWSPHVATCLIGITFVALWLLAGAWSYTDVLADLARRMAHSALARVLLALALLAGALAGGWMTGQWRRRPLAARDVLRCLAGGLIMGWGSLLIPGGNDGLVLLGMPLLWPYAWASFVTMCVVIYGALRLRAG